MKQPIQLDHPTLQAFIAGINEGEPAEPCVDWLQEQGQTLADVLLLFAGTAPDFVDGLPQSVLVAWCKATEPAVNHPKATDVRFGVRLRDEGISFIGHPDSDSFKRWFNVERIRAEVLEMDGAGRGSVFIIHPREKTEYDVSVWERDYQNERLWAAACQKTEDMQRRAVKRRVLSLFPEVNWIWQVKIQERDIAAVNRNNFGLEMFVINRFMPMLPTGYFSTINRRQDMVRIAHWGCRAIQSRFPVSLPGFEDPSFRWETPVGVFTFGQAPPSDFVFYRRWTAAQLIPPEQDRLTSAINEASDEVNRVARQSGRFGSRPLRDTGTLRRSIG